VSFKIILTTSVRDKTVFHNTTPDLQDQDQDHSVQDQDQDRFLVSDRSCPKTGGLRPHHWCIPFWAMTVDSWGVVPELGRYQGGVSGCRNIPARGFIELTFHVSVCSNLLTVDSLHETFYTLIQRAD